MSNLRQIGAWMQMYLNDKDGILPGSARDVDGHRLQPSHLSQVRRD